MKIHHELQSREGRAPLALAIGFFDGVHRGHRALLEQLQRTKQPDWRLAALSFERHPLWYLRPADAPELLVSLEERVNLLARAGVEELYLIPFDQQLASLEPEVFLEEMLIRRLQVGSVAVGVSFCFGAARRGDVALAAQMLAQHGVDFFAVPHVLDNGERISSTRVRAALKCGDLADVDRMLGEPFRLMGQVVLGAGRGHDLGFPTANLDIQPGLLLPPDGVYTAVVLHDGTRYRGLVSIGTNPTFVGSARTVEVWIADFAQSIYGEFLKVEELRFLRGQRAFASVDELVKQMHADAEAIRN